MEYINVRVVYAFRNASTENEIKQRHERAFEGTHEQTNKQTTERADVYVVRFD